MNANGQPDQMASQNRRPVKKGAQNDRKERNVPPDGFYCYYPELFEKANTQIFVITRVPRARPRLLSIAQSLPQQPQEEKLK